MKRGKVIGKSQIVLGLLVATLGLAVFLNMKFSSETFNGTDYNKNDKNLGEALFVNDDITSSIETSANVSYITTAKKERNDSRDAKINEITETLENSEADNSIKLEAMNQLKTITNRIEQEANIETIVKSKGFSDALCIVSNESISVIVSKDGELLQSETLQIQDAVLSQISVDLEKITIITVK